MDAHGKLICYADNTVLFDEGQSWDKVFASVHFDTSKIQKLPCENNLFLNLEKTYILPFYILNLNQPNRTNLCIHENECLNQNMYVTVQT